MAMLEEIERFLNHELAVDMISDYMPNGVQVRGQPVVNRVVTGVSACVDLFDAAIAQQADLVLVHHGMFWEKEPRIVEGSMKQRLLRLLQHDMTLMAYHLPLDSHAVYGNNAQILAHLELKPEQPFGHYRGRTLSWIGSFAAPVAIEAVMTLAGRVFGGQPQVIPHGRTTIVRVAVCSGGAPELVREAKQAGADLFITGEMSEPLFHYAKEEAINVIVAGHHRTEKFGVQALGALLERRFGVQHRFVDINNPA